MLLRILKAVDYIEDHLGDDLVFAPIANAACLSPYHFMRVFYAHTGMTLGVYVRRRRLSRAAKDLLSTSDRIIDIALAAGFESQASFTRAFKEMFDMPPALFRQKCKTLPFHNQPVITHDYLQHLTKGKVTMTPQFKKKEAFTIIGIGKDFTPFDSDMIGKLWDDFLALKQTIPLVLSTEAYGVCSEPVEGQPFPDKFHYTAGLTVKSDAPVPSRMEKITIPEQTYAVFTHKGKITELSKTVNYIWKTWLPHSNFHHANSPDFEVYDQRWTGDQDQSEMDIYIPVIAK